MTDFYRCIVLPFPPSVNNLFSGKAKRFVSPRYREWKAEAAFALRNQGPTPAFPGDVKVVYKYGRPDKCRRDLGNLEKAVSDFLVEHRIIEDDSLIQRIVLEWDDSVTGVQVEVETT